MRHWQQGVGFYRNRREKQLRRLQTMRDAKARIRQERIAAGLLEREPKLERYFPLEFGVRVKATGETHFHDLVSIRHAAKALGLILKYFP
jgi:hypothetical protein